MGAALLFSFIRLFGVEEDGFFDLADTGVVIEELILVQGLIIGLAFGLGFGLLDLLLEGKFLRRYSYWLIILIRTFAHIVFTIGLLVASILGVHVMMGDPLNESATELLIETLTTRSALVFLIYTGVVSILFNLMRQMNAMFGPGILVKILMGKYHRPQEENRIFMFLDLKSSTTYGERLGHILYSELIQDCFYDLTDTVQQHDVEIYQYVGDEAVLTWRVEDGLRNANCIEAYFSFEESIQRRSNYYFNKYDLVPVFKAGVNLGLVMAAEVGVVKKEIAYHSDVLNTAARIQGECNRLGKPLLISQIVKDSLKVVSDYEIESVGEVSLKGKEQRINLFSVSKKEKVEHPYEFSE